MTAVRVSALCEDCESEPLQRKPYQISRLNVHKLSM